MAIDIQSAIVSAASAAGIDPSVALRVAQIESSFNPSATSIKGAMGIFQLMPATAAQLGVTNPYDPLQNISGGVRYLAQLFARYGDWYLAAAAYNWGLGNVDKALASGTGFPSDVQAYAASASGESSPLSGSASAGISSGITQGGLTQPVYPDTSSTDDSASAGIDSSALAGLSDTELGLLLAGGFLVALFAIS